jgi:hypothetical protein
MIKVGQHKKAKYWGNYMINQVVQLAQPVKCECEEIGEALFSLTLVKIEWEKPPSNDKHDIWFPYWISINGKEKFGQFAPMIGEKALSELFANTIEQGFFTDQFLSKIKNCAEKKLGSNNA